MRDIILFNKKEFVSLQDVKSKDEVDNASEGYFIDNPEEKEIRKIVDKLRKKGKMIAVQSYDNNLNRRILETMNINYLVFPENIPKKDNLKQRDSGINHVTAKIAKEKGVALLINLSEIQRKEGKECALILSRIIQNIKICRRIGTKIKIASLARKEKEVLEKKEMQEFLLSLGASTEQAKEAIIY